MSQDFFEEVCDVARRELRRQPDEEIRREQRLVEDLQLDSIELLTLATAVEDHFLIRLDEEDEASLETVGDLVALVEKKVEHGVEHEVERRETDEGG